MKFGRICASAMLLAIACTAAPDREAPREQPEPIFKDEPNFEGRGLPLIATGLADLAAVCELLSTRECPKSDDCGCGTSLSDEVGGWALPTLHLSERREVRYPAIRTTEGWTLFRPLIRTKTTGIWGYYEYTSFDELESFVPERPDLIPGGEPEFVFRFDKGHEAGDNASLPDDASSVWQMRLVCARDRSEARCTRPLLDEFKFSQSRPGDVYEHYDAEISLGAEVVVSRVTGEQVLEHYEQTPEALALPAGTYPLMELLEPPPQESKQR